MQRPHRPDVHLEGLAGLDRLTAPPSLPFEPVFHAIEPARPPPCAAVDGSHAVLADTGSTWVVAARAAYLPWPGVAAPPPTRVVGTTADAAQTTAEAAYAQHGLSAPRVASAEALAEALRALDELAAATRAIQALPEGGLLLIDGALTQLPEAAQSMSDRILDRATASGIHVAGVSKRSALCAAGVPLVPAIDAIGRRRGPPAWWAPVPGNTAVVARLHPRAAHAFRIDAETAALPWLADLARDAVYLGYPYPLAKVHNLVAISRQEARRMCEHVDRAMGEAAPRLHDFHQVLDRNAPR